MIGITGTNGKTTVSFMVEAIARSAGVATGLMGTIVTRSGDRLIDNPRTTPEATDFLVEKGYNPDYGARPLRRAIEHEMEDPLAEEVLRGQYGPNTHLIVGFDAEEKKLTFETVDRPAEYEWREPKPEEEEETPEEATAVCGLLGS